MTVLVLGSTGFLGPTVVQALSDAGADVVGASRSGTGPHGTAIDRRDVASVRRIVRERRVSAVIDLISYTEADTLALVSAVKDEVDRWVMASSGDVYRNYEGLNRHAEPEPLAAPISENSALRTTRHPYRTKPRRDPSSPDAWMDDYDKIPLETHVRECFGRSAVILRLPMIYGPGDRQRRFNWIISPMLAGKTRLTIDPAWAAWRTTYGYVDDVGHALATAALHSNGAGRTFNIGEVDGPDHLGWVGRFAQSLGWAGVVEHVQAPRDSPLSAMNLDYSMQTDTTAFREACQWTEPTPLEDALSRTIADEKRRGRSSP